MVEPEKVIHPIEPLFNKDSETLILGSFPSVRSRETMFFYGHPQNRFWKLLPLIFGGEVPQTTEEKKALVLQNRLALWDVIHSCTVTGSSDSSITDVVPNDLSVILENSRVSRIFCNGALSYKLYQKYIFPVTGIKAVKLPSTSPANTAWSMDRLLEEWRVLSAP